MSYNQVQAQIQDKIKQQYSWVLMGLLYLVLLGIGINSSFPVELYLFQGLYPIIQYQLIFLNDVKKYIMLIPISLIQDSYQNILPISTLWSIVFSAKITNSISEQYKKDNFSKPLNKVLNFTIFASLETILLITINVLFYKIDINLIAILSRIFIALFFYFLFFTKNLNL